MSIVQLAKEGDQEGLAKLLGPTVDLEEKDDHDFTALHWACWKKHVGIAKLLLEQGAKPNVKNCAGDSPLHYACIAGLDEIVQLLLKNGADPVAVNFAGNTPLHYACFWRRDEICLLLIENKAPLTVLNKQGKTPLARAGPKLSSRLRVRGSDLGLTQDIVKLKVKSEEDIQADAKHKFMAKVGVKWDVGPGTIKFGELISNRSHLAQTYFGQWNNMKVVVKKRREQNLKPDDIKKLSDEIDAIRKIWHSNLLPLMGACIEVPHVSLLYEYMPQGSLYQLVHDPTFDMSQEQAIKLAVETSKGLVYLHENEMPHYNLKSSNIMVTENLSVKLSEWGFYKSAMNSSTFNQKRLYDPQWIAPEVLQRNNVENYKAADVYSFGVVLYEIITRQIPFDAINAMHLGLKILLEGMRPEIPSFVPPHFAQLMDLCWQEEPARRPTISQVFAVLEKCTP